MKPAVSIVLIVFGALVVLGPVVAHAYLSNQDKERVATFYSRSETVIGTGYASLPSDLRPTEYGLYDFACLGVGAIMVAMGVTTAASGCRQPPA